MAITGVFGADFSAFNEAVTQADIKLRGFQDDSSKVEQSLTRMGNTFTGVKVVQEAALMAEAIQRVGGVTQLTTAELDRAGKAASAAIDKLTAMGKEVPEGIQRMSDAVKEAQGSWGSFTSSLNIDTALKNPLGTAKDAMTALAGEMGPTAVAALGVTAGVAAIGAELFHLTSEAAAVGASLDSMNQKTGMSVPTLSRYGNAAVVAGSSLETLTSTVFKLEQQIGQNSSKFQEGLAAIGLSTEQLKAVGVDHYLETVALGLAAIPDPSDRAAAGTKLLGNSYKEVADVLGDLPDAMALVNDLQPWTPEQAKQAQEFEMQMASLKLHLAATGMEIGKTLLPYVDAFVARLPAAIEGTKQWALSFVGLDHFGERVDWFTAAWETMTGTVSQPLQLDTDEATRKLKALRDAAFDAARTPDALVANWKAAGGAVPLHVKTIEEAFAGAKSAERDLDAQTAKSAAEQKKLADALVELASVGGSWHETLDGIDGEVVAAVEYYLQAGVAQGTLATAYGLTATQVKAVSAALKEQMDTEKLLEELHKQTEQLDRERAKQATKDKNALNATILAGYEQIQRAEDDVARFTQRSETTTFDLKMQHIQAWAENSKATFKGTADQYDAYAAAIDAKALFLQQQLIAGENAHTTAVQTNTDQRVAAHDREYAAIDRIIGASRTLGDLSKADSSNTDPIVLAYMQQGYTANEALALARGGGGSNGIFGAPERRSLSGGFGATDGFGSVSNVFNLTDTADGLARKVSDILTRDVYRGTKGA